MLRPIHSPFCTYVTPKMNVWDPAVGEAESVDLSGVWSFVGDIGQMAKRLCCPYIFRMIFETELQYRYFVKFLNLNLLNFLTHLPRCKCQREEAMYPKGTIL